MTVTLLFLLAAFVCTIANALGKCPAWVPLILIILILMLGVLPR
jgi:hypothetical protein